MQQILIRLQHRQQRATHQRQVQSLFQVFLIPFWQAVHNQRFRNRSQPKQAQQSAEMLCRFTQPLPANFKRCRQAIAVGHLWNHLLQSSGAELLGF